MKRLFSLFFLLFCLALSSAAEHRNIKIERLDRKEGLSSSRIFSIAQDQFGFVWIATENGLERFDGCRFISYKNDPEDSYSLAGNSINKLLVDEDGFLWVATKYKGLDRYDPVMDRFTHFVPDGSEGCISGPAVTDICSSSTGKMWVSTYYDGLNLMDPKTGKFEAWYNTGKSTDVLQENIILSILEDGRNRLWIGYHSQGLTCIDLNTNNVKHFKNSLTDADSLPAGKVQEILEDRMGNIWIGTENGLALYNASKESFVNFHHDSSDPESLVGDNVMTICEMEDGKIWIGTENGGISILDYSLSLLEGNKISFRNILRGDSSNDLSYDSIYDIFQDSYGNIWAGTYGMGINFISKSPSLFNNLQYIPFSNDPDNLNNKTAWGICESPDGNLWVGTDGGGINIYNKQKEKIGLVQPSPTTIGDDAVLCALTDSRGRMWFGTYAGGLSRYDSETGRFTQFLHDEGNRNSIPANDVRTVYEDKEGRIFVGTMGGLCLYREETFDFQVFTEKDVLLAGNCRAVVQADDGCYWIGHHGGITCLNPDLSLKTSYVNKKWGESEGLNCDNIYSEYKDRKGRIWFGTDAGLARWIPEEEVFRFYSIKEGLADNFVRAITQDEVGKLWLSTNNTISCFDPETEIFINYTYKDGIPLGEFMDNSCLNGSDGKIYFGSSDGLCSFSPLLIFNKIRMPAINFTGFNLYDEAIAPEEDGILPQNVVFLDKITLKHDQNVFTIHYSLPDYDLRNMVFYRYRMEGLDSQWMNDKDLNYASYKNVPPGKYRFCVQASMNSFDWSGPVAELEVEILQPLWLRWWMKLIYLLLASSLIWYFFKMYTNRMNLKRDLMIEQMRLKEVEELNQEKLQFFTNISHDIKTPLTLILAPINDMLRQDFPQDVKKKLTLINNNANHLLKMFNRLLAFRKVENGYAELSLSKGNVIGLVMDVCLSYHELRSDEKVSFSYRTEVEELTIWYDSEKVYSIVDNLISNALKYTKSGCVSVLTRVVEKENGKYLEISVKDTGIGLTEEEKKQIFERFYQAKNMTTAMGTGIGLALVDNFVRIHKGYINLQSKKGEGSCFTVGIPCFLKPAQKETHEVVVETPESYDGRLMLVVDDNKDICDYVCSCFSDEFRVMTAHNGKDAYKIVLRELPDIVISDVMMDEMDGIELCRRIKQNEATSHIPVILLTAKSSVDAKKEGYDVGADSYVSKPFSSELLVTRVHNIFQARKKITDYISKKLFNAESQEEKRQTDEVRQNKLIGELISIVEENMSEGGLDMEFLAGKLCMSHSSLFRKVKALTGLSVNEFIRGIRMQKAKDYLSTGEYSISEVSYMVGINSLRYFRQCFKESYGMTPTEFMKKQR